jgi:hypothetical protein
MTRYPLLLLVALAGVTASAAGPDPKYKAPRTENGQPDLQGMWNFSSDVPLQRPASAADRKFFTREELQARKAAKAKAFTMIQTFAPVEAVSIDWLETSGRLEDLRTSIITYPDNGRLPALVDGVRRSPSPDEIIGALAEGKGLPPELAAFMAPGKKDGPEDLGAAGRCLTGGGPPYTPDIDNDFVQIIQARDHVVLRREGHTRIVPLDGRPPVSGKLRSWAGDSRGHWDGETLVVDTRNFNRRTSSFAGAGNSLEKVVTERFTRTSSHTLEYEATVVDPKTFQDKVSFSLPVPKVDVQLYEWACHEGNYSMWNTLSAARKEEREAAK